MPTIVLFDTKPYDREFMASAAGAGSVEWVFHEFRLGAETAASARGGTAVCGFVNDRIDRACLETLAAEGIGHVAMRCAGFNNVDLDAAREAGVACLPCWGRAALAKADWRCRQLRSAPPTTLTASPLSPWPRLIRNIRSSQPWPKRWRSASPRGPPHSLGDRPNCWHNYVLATSS